MFFIHVFDEVRLASEDTAGWFTTVVPSMLSNPEDLSFAGRLIVRIKGPSGVKIAARRAADLYGETRATFSISSFLRVLDYLLLSNFALF